MPIRVTELSKKWLVLFFTVISFLASSADQLPFAIKQFRRDSSGVTFVTAAGAMRIEGCGDRVVHVVASSTSEIPAPKVPVVTQPCNGQNLQVASEKNDVKLSTGMITVKVDRATGA